MIFLSFSTRFGKVKDIFKNECDNARNLIKKAICKAKQYSAMSGVVTPMTAGVVKDFTKVLFRHSGKVGKAMFKVLAEAGKFPIVIFKSLRQSMVCFKKDYTPKAE